MKVSEDYCAEKSKGSPDRADRGTITEPNSN
jgi:hypothetical protein